MKKFLAILLSAMLMLSLTVPAMAQSEDANDGGVATITIKNAAKGETYSVVKIFDASVTGVQDGSIAYTGTIPDDLKSVFSQDSAGNISVAEGVSAEMVINAVTSWAKAQAPTVSIVSDGSELIFTGLKYGYYAVITTQGAVVTVNSTNPNAVVTDKNTKEPGIIKDVNDPDVDIGQTVTYSVTSNTANYLKTADGKFEIVTEYVISDTLPDFLTDVNVTSIQIKQPKGDDIPLAIQQFADKKITITWAKKVDGKYVSLYENGSQIVITYTAKVTDNAIIDGTTGNKNVVTLTPHTTPDENATPDPWEKTWDDDEVIFTYAAALQKVDQNNKPLAGAKFSAKGLTVKNVSDGVYMVVSYDPSVTSEYGTEMETDAQGQLVILGLSSDSKLTVKETAAPAGYNMLTVPTEMTPVKTGEEIVATTTTIYYDANGKVTDQQTSTHYEKTTYNVSLLKTAIVVVNNVGTELPETGGIGTTIFYIVGGVMVAAAVVLLITKKRMSAEG